MSNLAMPQGVPNTNKIPDWCPKEHDYTTQVCQHMSSVWGSKIAIPGVDPLGRPAIEIREDTRQTYSRCHRKCAKFLPSEKDDPSNKNAHADGTCADVVTALEACKMSKLLTTLGLQLDAGRRQAAQDQFPNMEEGLAAVAAQDEDTPEVEA